MQHCTAQLPELPVCDRVYMYDLYCSCGVKLTPNGAMSDCFVRYAGCGRHDGVIFAWSTTCLDAMIDTAAEGGLRIMFVYRVSVLSLTRS
jgi:hypothetical protein